MICKRCCFFFNDTATTEIYTLSLHDALPILFGQISTNHSLSDLFAMGASPQSALAIATLPYATEAKQEETLYQLLSGALKTLRSEEHTSELQSRQYLVCRLLLEKKKIIHLLP